MSDELRDGEDMEEKIESKCSNYIVCCNNVFLADKLSEVKKTDNDTELDETRSQAGITHASDTESDDELDEEEKLL